MGAEMRPAWPQPAARCVHCREWEGYGDISLTKIDRSIGVVYAHNGCYISWLRIRLLSPAVGFPVFSSVSF